MFSTQYLFNFAISISHVYHLIILPTLPSAIHGSLLSLRLVTSRRMRMRVEDPRFRPQSDGHRSREMSRSLELGTAITSPCSLPSAPLVYLAGRPGSTCETLAVGQDRVAIAMRSATRERDVCRCFALTSQHATCSFVDSCLRSPKSRASPHAHIAR